MVLSPLVLFLGYYMHSGLGSIARLFGVSAVAESGWGVGGNAPKKFDWEGQRCFAPPPPTTKC